MRPRYSLVVDEDVKKSTKQTYKSTVQADQYIFLFICEVCVSLFPKQEKKYLGKGQSDLIIDKSNKTLKVSTYLSAHTHAPEGHVFLSDDRDHTHSYTSQSSSTIAPGDCQLQGSSPPLQAEGMMYLVSLLYRPVRTHDHSVMTPCW